jgi:hypothetical protein
MFIKGDIDSNQKIAGNGLVLNVDAAQYRSFPRGGNIVTSGLVLNFDAGNLSSYPKSGTTWFDLSGNGTNGTLVNGPTYNASNQGSLVFDGTDDRVTASNANLIHGTSNWTYSAWVNFNSTPSLGTLFENGSWTNCLLIRYETNNFAIYSMSSLWGRFYWTPSIGVWYKLDFFRNGNTLFFYIDGVSYSSMSFSANISPSANLFIASSQHVAGQCFNGRIATFQVYNRALSGAEITQNYDALKYRYGLIGSTWFDLSGNANNGTLTNGPTLDFNNGGSIVFDGTNDYVNTSLIYSLLSSSTEFSCSCWFKCGAQSTNNLLISNYDGDPIPFNLYVFSDGTVVGITRNSASQSVTISSTSTYADSNYHNAFYIKDSSGNYYIYVDGVLKNSSNANLGTITSTTPIQIGKLSTLSQAYFNGSIANVQIYNRALSATEVLNNFNAVKSRFGYVEGVVTNGLVLWLDAGDTSSYSGSGTSWLDISGYGNNATLINGPTFNSANGGSIVFDGVDDYASAGSVSQINNIVEMCINTWVYPISTAYYTYFVSRYGDITANRGWSIYAGTGDYANTVKFSAFVNTNGIQYTVSPFGGNNYPINNWYNITLVRTSSSPQLKLYINGIFVASDTATTDTIANNTLRIGGSTLGYKQNRNAITQAYNRALSESEVKRNFNAFVTRYYTPSVVTSGLVINLDASNTSSYPGSGTTWFDISGNGYNVTLTNGPTYSAGGGGYFTFDGVDDYGVLNMPWPATMTVAYWIKLPTTPPTNYNRIFGSNGYRFEMALGYYYTPTNNWRSFSYNGIGDPLTGWTYVVWAQSGNTASMYVNSRLNAPNYPLNTTSGTGNLIRLGSSYINSEFLNMNIADFKVYNRTLSAAEVMQNYFAQKSRFGL